MSGRQLEALQGQGAPGRIGVQKVSKVVQVGSRGVHLPRGDVHCCILEPMTVLMADIWQGERISNDVAWNEMFVIDASLKGPASKESKTIKDIGETDVLSTLDGRPLMVLVTVQQKGTSLDEGEVGEGEVLGEVLVKMDGGMGAVADGWFPLSRYGTRSAHPRVVHPSPRVLVYLRLRYAVMIRQMSGGDRGGALPGTPRAVQGAPDDDVGDGISRGGGKFDEAMTETDNGRMPEHGGVGGTETRLASARTRADSLAVAVEVVSSAGIRAPGEYPGGRFWCCASAVSSKDGNDLKHVEHLVPEGLVLGVCKAPAGAAEGSNPNAIVAQAWSLHSDLPAAQSEAGSSTVAARCGWVSSKMALTVSTEGDRGEWSTSAAAAPDSSAVDGGEMLTVLVTLHAWLDGQDQGNERSSEVARAVVAVRQGLVAEEWCQALAPWHEPLIALTGGPSLVQLRVSCAPADSDKDALRPRLTLKSHAVAAPIFGILDLCIAMMAAGPPASSLLPPSRPESFFEGADIHDFVLPRGWISRVSSSKPGRVYFSHARSSQSTWTPPRGALLAIARIPSAARSASLGTGQGDGRGDTGDGWAVCVTIKAAVGLAYCGPHVAGESPPASRLIHSRGAKVARLRLAASLVFFQQGDVAAADLLALEHTDVDGGGPSVADGRRMPPRTHSFDVKPQWVSQAVTMGSGLLDVNETFVLRRTTVACCGGLVTNSAGRADGAVDKVSVDGAAEAPLEIALKGRVVMLLVTVHGPDETADCTNARILVPLRPGPSPKGGGIWYPLLSRAGYPLQPFSTAACPDGALPPMLHVEASYDHSTCRPWPPASQAAHVPMISALSWMKVGDDFRSNALPVPTTAPAASLHSPQSPAMLEILHARQVRFSANARLLHSPCKKTLPFATSFLSQGAA